MEQGVESIKQFLLLKRMVRRGKVKNVMVQKKRGHAWKRGRGKGICHFAEVANPKHLTRGQTKGQLGFPILYQISHSQLCPKQWAMHVFKPFSSHHSSQPSLNSPPPNPSFITEPSFPHTFPSLTTPTHLSLSLFISLWHFIKYFARWPKWENLQS